MYEDYFCQRLTQLRLNKGVSARDMSLSIGQNPGYINNIETGKALPSMTSFFYICEYLDISPVEFFSYDSPYPKEMNSLQQNLNKLSASQLKNISEIVADLASKK